jgi:uncharacterized membrane protein HdeD (DUF308 family)
MNDVGIGYSAHDAIKASSGLTIALGVALIVLGVLAVLAPVFAGVGVAILVGVLMIVAGIARSLFAFRARTWVKGVFGFLLGAFVTLGGILLLIRPWLGLVSLTLLLAAYFFMEGVFEIVYALKHRAFQGWGWMFAGGVVTFLLGFLIWIEWPVSGIWAIGILVGLHFVLGGAALIGLGTACRKGAGSLEALGSSGTEAI